MAAPVRAGSPWYDVGSIDHVAETVDLENGEVENIYIAMRAESA